MKKSYKQGSLFETNGEENGVAVKLRGWRIDGGESEAIVDYPKMSPLQTFMPRGAPAPSVGALHVAILRSQQTFKK